MNPTPPTVDILSEKTAYVHFSLPDTRIVIFDVSGCDFIATKPSADGTLAAIKDGEKIKLKPVKRIL